MKKTNTPQWLTLVGKIADSWHASGRSAEHDRTDRRVLASVVESLLDGRTLTARQSAAFLNSIRTRLGGGYRGLQWEGDIFLTANQVKYARSQGMRERLINKFRVVEDEVHGIQVGETGSTSTQVQPNFNSTSTQVQLRFNPTSTQLHPYFNPTSTKNGEKANDCNGLGALTTHNNTEQNNTAPHNTSAAHSSSSGMTATSSSASHCQLASPSDNVAASQPHERNARSLPLTSHAPVLAMGVVDGHLEEEERDHHSAKIAEAEEMARAIRRQLEQRGTAAPAATRAPNEPEPLHKPIVYKQPDMDSLARATESHRQRIREEEADKAREALRLIDSMNTTVRFKKAQFEVALWQTEDKLSGTLTVAGTKYFLDFSGWGSVEGRMSAAQHDPADRAWWNYAVVDAHGDLFRAWRTGSHEVHHVFGLSPLLSGMYGDAHVESANAVVRAVWQGHQVVGVEFMNGMDRFDIPVRINTSKGVNAPHYKGSV